MTLKTIVLVALFLLSTASVARAESLWDRRRGDSAFLYRDRVAGEIGDSLTVLVTESSVFKLSDSRKMDKSSGHSASASFGVTQHGSEKRKLFDPFELSESSSHEFEGGADYSGSRTFSDTLTVTVVDRLPNGNLVVAGRSERNVAGEVAVTIITGIVRPDDVSGANTVSSKLVAQLRLHYETTGPSKSFLNQGFLARIISHIWPF